MKVSDITEQNLTPEIVDRILFDGLEYKGQRADLILVPGSLKAYCYRVPLAATLYHNKKVDKMIFCGGKIRTFPDGDILSECEKMKESALKSGIPEKDIFLENRSETTAENFTFAKDIIAKEMPRSKSAILVTTAYHQRRAVKLAEKILGLEIYPCPADNGSARRDNWFKTEKGRKTALDECLKFGYYIMQGLIDDFEI